MNNAHLMIVALALAAFVGSMHTGCEATDPPGSSGDSDSDADTDGDADSDADSDGDADHTLLSISIEPMNYILEVDLDTPATMPYQAIGHYEDNVDEDLTAEVTWSNGNADLGAFNGANLEIPAITEAGAEVTIVKAEYGDEFDSNAQLTVVAYRMTGPSQDFFFNLPYQDEEGSQEKPLDFSTAVPSLDVFFNMDTTGSMGGTISSLQSSLTGTIIPSLQASIPDTWFGVGAFEDFPLDGYGSDPCYTTSEPDQPFELLQAMTDDSTLALAGVNALSQGSSPIGCGADGAESMIESLYQIATGEGLTAPDPTDVPAYTGPGNGGVGFRDYSLPAIVPLTDIYSHMGVNSSYDYAGSVALVAHTQAEAIDALNEICSRVVGVATTSGDPDMIAMAEATGAVVPPEAWGDASSRPAGCAVGQCCTGINGAGRAVNIDGMCPLAYLHSSGTGVGDTIVTGLEMLTRYAAFDCVTETEGVDTDIDGVPLPTGHTTADFIQAITPDSYAVPSDPPGLPEPEMTADGFNNVTPGTVVTFQVEAFNDFVEQTTQAQFFEATISVLAGGCFPLDDRTVLILVPPIPIDIQ